MSDLRFEREFPCPHCRKSVAWRENPSQCPFCEGAFAPGVPLAPKPPRSLARILTGAWDVAKARQWEYLEADGKRRSENLFRAWAALSRNDAAGEMDEASSPAGTVRRQPVKRAKPVKWYQRGLVWTGLAVVLALLGWGGLTAWRTATKQAILERLAGLSSAARQADGQAVGSFYGASLTRFQTRYDVPHKTAVRALRQVFRDYPFVIQFAYKKPLFESVSLEEVSLLVDQEWELRGNETYSGSERHRLIWSRENGEWLITSEELIHTNWSRKSSSGTNVAGGTTAIGVQP